MVDHNPCRQFELRSDPANVCPGTLVMLLNENVYLIIKNVADKLCKHAKSYYFLEIDNTVSVKILLSGF